MLLRRFRRPPEAPTSTTEAMKSLWWYYTVQLKDETIVKGLYADGYPFPPRIMQRRVDLAGMDCLDIGSAEGVLPILAKKNGAKSVVATDYSDENFEKMSYLAACHGVSLTQRTIGRAQNVAILEKEFPAGFDYINLSGVLYHVTSPIDVVAAARRLLRPNGIMLVSNICVLADEAFLQFNDRGRFQSHHSVFWYMSIAFFDYMLRMLCLAPIDVLYFGDDKMGYAPVLCRAMPGPCTEPDDSFMEPCLQLSLELSEHWRSSSHARLPPSTIGLKSPEHSELVRRPQTDTVDLYETTKKYGSIAVPSRTQDSRLFLLSDQE